MICRITFSNTHRTESVSVMGHEQDQCRVNGTIQFISIKIYVHDDKCILNTHVEQWNNSQQCLFLEKYQSHLENAVKSIIIRVKMTTTVTMVTTTPVVWIHRQQPSDLQQRHLPALTITTDQVTSIYRHQVAPYLHSYFGAVALRQSFGLAIIRSWVRFSPGQSCVTTLGMSIIHMCLCHQTV